MSQSHWRKRPPHISHYTFGEKYKKKKIKLWKSQITANVLISENGNNLFYNKAISDIIKHHSPFVLFFFLFRLYFVSFSVCMAAFARSIARYYFARLDALGRR